MGIEPETPGFEGNKEHIYKIEAKGKASEKEPGIFSYFIAAREINASDIYFSVDECPVMKLHGKFHKLLESPAYRAEEVQRLIYEILTPKQIDWFEHNYDIELVYLHDLTGSIRINIYHTHKGMAAACRLIPIHIPTFKELGPEGALKNIASMDDGFVLITGEARSGKSTTLASIIEYINIYKKKCIITIEDMIEFHHYNQSSLIDQRQVGLHTRDVQSAINSAVRSKADVIVITDLMCSSDCLSMVLNAAEAGTLVIGVLRTFSGSGEAIYRMLNFFSEQMQPFIRYQLSRVLRAIVWQHLLPLKDHKGSVPAMEILVNTKKIAELIRTNQLDKINREVMKGSHVGMQTMEQSFELLKKVHEFEEGVSLAFRYGKYLLALL